MSISSSQEKSMKTQNEIWQEYYKQRKAPSYPTDAIARFFEKYAKSGDKVLDLGCGAGRHTLMLAQMGFEVSAIDFAKNSIDFTNELLANNSFKADLRVASADALPFCDDYFDALVCYGIHMYGDKDFVENVTNEIYRVLKKGGKAIIQFRSKDDYRYKNGEKIVNATNGSYEIAEIENGVNYYCEITYDTVTKKTEKVTLFLEN